MADRSRRDRKSKLDKLADYKKARQGGRREWKQQDDNDIYDEVTEDQYKHVVSDRLLKDDFVVDDGVDGYMDNGMDDYEERQYSSEEEVRSKKLKNKSANDKKQKSIPKPGPITTISAYRPAVTKEKEEDFMESLLGEMKAAPPQVHRPKPPVNDSFTRKRKTSYEHFDDCSSSPVRSGGYPSSEPPSDGFEIVPATGPSDDLLFSPTKRARLSNITPAAIDKLHEININDEFDSSFDDIDDSAFMDIDVPDLPAAEVKKEEADHNMQLKVEEEEKKAPTWLAVHASLTVKTDDNFGPLASVKGSSAANSKISVLEEDDSLRLYWLDYLEQDGKVYLVGKVIDKPTGAWISCCLTVDGLKRNLFVLPRERRLDEEEYETDEPPTMGDIHSDFDHIRRKAGIKSFRMKNVKRNYAFGETGVPANAEWFKVTYGFDEPQVPHNISSPSFSRVFGTGTSAFELFVLKRKIMGPCWLEVKKPELSDKGVSWCKLEFVVDDLKNVTPIPDNQDNDLKDPPLTIMSLSVRTVVNHQENKREIVCATARTWSNIQIDDPTPPEKLPCSVHTYVRPLEKYPRDFEKSARSRKTSIIAPAANERMLITSLLALIHRADPDVIVGHDFLGVSLDVLLHRMRELKVEHWSRIGRFRRSRWPNVGRQATNLKFLSGRLLCDLASDGAKGMIASTTWSLTEMCQTHLRHDREDIDPNDTALYFDCAVSSPEKLLQFVQHCEMDAHFQMAIAAKVQILPLTRQLTNLAGNSWNKTLNGGRAERNEYILLHEFHRLKYICPDKTWSKKSAAVVKVEGEEGNDAAATTTKSKRDKYKGGLVFEPKRGLWDKYILVMDFNSLYPSIIQEYNIDFTTVERTEGEDGDSIPEPPSSDVAQGVLPRLIATLVNRRRQVKSLMKDKNASQAELLQWDIKQQALKLTANSMYGCLGFEYSRFYARPLAALTTFKGREILTHTRELAESLQLDVVYGDTDSVFVNSNVTTLPDALKIAHEFKKHVNDRYKLLEIDLDGVFQRLLLLQKKKYAAVKVEDNNRSSTEVKGLDMKRREYSKLSKDVSNFVLSRILSGEPTEVVVEKIHEYLTNLGVAVRAGKIDVADYIIFKRLGKNPEDYPDAKSQPHVQVALRMKARGGTARGGDVIPYIFCIGADGQSSKTAQADKAMHPEELKKLESQIDFEYYLSNQILPPIERLCEPIEGTDRARLADCLGLDPSKYRMSTGSNEEFQGFGTLDSQMPDSERFRDAAAFEVRCRSCEGLFQYHPLSDSKQSTFSAAGPICPGCQATLSTGSLRCQLETQIRRHISRYYEAWLICDDPTCGRRTRMMSVYGRRCLRTECRGQVYREYTDSQLYTQLLYFASLFDSEKAVNSARGTTRQDEVAAIARQNLLFFRSMSSAISKYLDHCGRRWVELAPLFSFMKL